MDGETKPVLTALLQATKASQRLPDDDGDRMFAATDPEFRRRTEAQGGRLLALVEKLMSQVDADAFSRFEEAHRLDEDDDAAFEPVTDVGDQLLEEVDTIVDQVKAGGRTVLAANVAKGEFVPKGARAPHVARIPKPQLLFEDKIDNSRGHLVPKITLKVNARVPLPDFSGPGPYPHPYEHELRTLEYADWMLSKNAVTEFPSLDDIPLTYVDTEAGLTQLMQHLEDESVREIAVDLEAHNVRSFQGFVCLMQLSTRFQDFLVDTLALRSHLQVLNTVFTNPNIVKVLHGADSDIGWLQRDFGVYMVNMFDTGQATRVLRYPSFGLAHLLDAFCGVKANKALQLADWRERPLPEEHKLYAREDTHYLLGIYDRLKNELLDSGCTSEGNLLASALARSNDVCATVYDKPAFTPTSYRGLLDKLQLQPAPSPDQERVFAALYEWRDRVAREQDESVFYVIPRRALVALTTHMPVTVQTLQRACNPLPVLVRAHARDIVELIAKAVKDASTMPPPPSSAAAAGIVSTPGVARYHAPLLSAVGRSFLPVTPTLKVPQSPSMITPSPGVTPSPSPVLNNDQLFESTGWLRTGSVDPARKAELAGAPPTLRPTAVTTRAGGVMRRIYGFPTTLESEDEGDSRDSSSGSGSDSELSEDALRRATAREVQEELTRVHFHEALPSQEEAALMAHAPAVVDVDVTDRSGGAGAGAGAGASEDAGSAPAVLAIPRSLDEIYALSNRNRKQNKDKKRSRNQSGDGGGGGGGGGGASHPPAPTSTPLEFMREIGWVEPGADPLAAVPPAVAEGHDSGAESGGSGRAEDTPFVPFDYNAAAERSGSGGGGSGGGGGNRSRQQRGNRTRRSNRGGRHGSNPYVVSSGGGGGGGGGGDDGGVAGGRTGGRGGRGGRRGGGGLSGGVRVGRGGAIHGGERSSTYRR